MRTLTTLMAVSLLLAAAGAYAVQYNVGPAQPYTSIGAVPWESLGPGDIVRIHWRATPYAEKILICTGGTVADPIIVEGVPDGSGNRPIITGNGATTRAALDYYGCERSLIMLGDRTTARDGGNNPIAFTDGKLIKNIIIRGLELRSAHPAYSFTDYAGDTVPCYNDNASAVFVEYGVNITIRDCVVTDCANGLFTAYQSKNVLIESNCVYGNGSVGNIFVHNIYTESQGIVFQYNRLGALRAGANGNNLKDRSIGTVVRYNWIEGGNRQLDLTNVDDPGYTADHYDLYVNHPDYFTAFVYGNILIEPAGDGNAQICHFGGDAGGLGSYKTQLYFYQNTVISKRTDYTSWFMLSTNDQYCDCRNNIRFPDPCGVD
ncbi:MAG: right-handed parallel beta-helix repeat-containing protein [Planctomycetota bacterium]